MFVKIPDHLRDKIDILGEIVRTVHIEKLKALYLRLKTLRTEALKRIIDGKSVGEQYASTCVCCGGSGQYHYCVNPYCGSNNEFETDDCLHFTPHELRLYLEIRVEYVALLHEALDTLKAGVNIGEMSATPKCPHEMN